MRCKFFEHFNRMWHVSCWLILMMSSSPSLQHVVKISGLSDAHTTQPTRNKNRRAIVIETFLRKTVERVLISVISNRHSDSCWIPMLWTEWKHGVKWFRVEKIDYSWYQQHKINCEVMTSLHARRSLGPENQKWKSSLGCTLETGNLVSTVDN